MDRIDLTMERFEVLVRWEVWHDYFEGGVTETKRCEV